MLYPSFFLFFYIQKTHPVDILFVFQLTQFLEFFLNTHFSPLPDAVSSSEDPLAGDQDGTTSVVVVAATPVLQGCLRLARKTSLNLS